MKKNFTTLRMSLFLLMGFFIVFSTNAQNTASKKLSMQGFLKDANGKAVVDGNKVLTFKIYDALAGGNLLWTKIFSTVPVIGGVYAVQLGASETGIQLSSLSWSIPYFVGITVESEPELAPRTEFTYAPYTFSVNKSNKADTASYALSAKGIGGELDMATLNFEANMRIIKNSKSSIDHDIYLGQGSGTTSSLHLFSNDNEAMSIANGNVIAKGIVGIGTTTPEATLDVARGNGRYGTAIFRGTEVQSYFYIGSEEATQINGGKRDSKVYINEGSTGNVLLALGGGSVGIGTANPQATLDVSRGGGGGTAIFRGSQYTSNFNSGAGEETYIRGGKAGSTVYINEGHNGNILLASGGGNVGIGTFSADAPLHVANHPTNTAVSLTQTRRWFNVNTPNDIYVSYPFFLNPIMNDVLIRADGSIWSNGGSFVATSDKRIKNIIGLTNTATDLGILNKIEITDYKYKDEISNGGGLQKKVIAQQLQEIYPRAINSTKGIIPNVFAVAKETKVLDQSTIINTTKPHDFASGDKVKLILEKTGEKELIVTVIDATTFSVAEAINDKVFVYGKHVNDLLTVDYDAVSMLNVSATQELAKQIEQLKAENAKIKSENKTYENRLIKIEAMLQMGGNLGTGK